MIKNLFIVVEGIDGTGKTTLAKELAHELKGKYYSCPPKIIKPIRGLADNGPYLLRYYYYALGNKIASLEIKKLLNKSCVICDWYVYSTVMYHSVLLKKHMPFPKVLMPDVVIYLSTTFQETKRRLEERHTTNKFEGLNFLKEVKKQYDEWSSSNSEIIKIDTTDKTLKQTMQEVVKMLNA